MSYIQSIMDDDSNGKDKFDLDTYLNELRLKNKYDPRKDIEEDSKLWIKVLKESEKVNRQIYGNLHGLRCVGCQLETKNNQLTLMQGSEIDKSEYNNYRREYLMPFKSEIKQIFGAVHQELISNESIIKNTV